MINDKAITNLETIFSANTIKQENKTAKDLEKQILEHVRIIANKQITFELNNILERSKIYVGDIEYRIDGEQLYLDLLNYIKGLKK